VGLYATLINVNAYHQPGVEAGKKAATAVLELQQQVVAFISKQSDSLSAAQIADAMGLSDKAETIYHILEHLAANKRFVSRRGRKFKKLTK
jgi:glucose-6-phosphate isomerase